MPFIQLTLARFNTLLDTRRRLITELDTIIANEHQQEQQPCHQDYIQQAISIATSGLIEIREEVQLLRLLLDSDLARPDLAALVHRIEALEADKLSEYLKKIVAKRKEHVEQRDLSQLITQHQEKIDDLSASVAELTEEIRAELAELVAAAE